MLKAAFYHIYNIRQIRKYLNKESTERMVHVFITNKLDYCNSLMYGLPNSQTQKLQRVQNAAAKIISGARTYEHVTPSLRELHWLPVKKRIEFKVPLSTYKALNDMAPEYLKDMLNIQRGRYTLRSTESIMLMIPRTKFKTRGNRSFAAAAPKLWNKLPVQVRRSQDIQTFKSRLKTHLIITAFNQ